MRYWTLLLVKGPQKYQRSKLEVERKSARVSRDPRAAVSNLAELMIFLLSSNFDLWYFCSLLIYKSAQYLIWKIYFIPVWSQILREPFCLLGSFKLSQSTPILPHRRAFVPKWVSLYTYALTWFWLHPMLWISWDSIQVVKYFVSP